MRVQSVPAASRGGRTLVDGMEHIPEDDLLLYALDMFTSDGAIAIEEHLLWCHACLERLELIEAQIAVGERENSVFEERRGQESGEPIKG